MRSMKLYLKHLFRGVFIFRSTNFAEYKVHKGAVDKIMGGENMTRNYNEAKTTIKYLENRYGKFYNLTNDEQKELQKSIILDHNKDDLNRMLRRIKGGIEVAKDTQAINVQPFSFFMVMIAALSSASIGIMTAAMAFLNSVFSKYLDTKDLTKMDASELLNVIDFATVIRTTILAVGVPFILIFVIWGLQHRVLTRNVDKRYIIKIFLEECLEDFNKVTQQVEPEKQK